MIDLRPKSSDSRSSDPMEVINYVGCLIEHVAAIADLLTAVEVEELCEGTIHKIGYAISNILERASDRLGEAKR